MIGERCWDHLEVESISWGDDEIDSPSRADLDRALVETPAGETLAIYLEDEGMPTAPQLILGREKAGWSVTYKSESDELWPAEELYDGAGAARIARLFFDEQRLDPADGWEQP